MSEKEPNRRLSAAQAKQGKFEFRLCHSAGVLRMAQLSTIGSSRSLRVAHGAIKACAGRFNRCKLRHGAEELRMAQDE
ncbi:hypothetical protein L195_g061551, partial [Trifolium pratense]